MRSLYLRIWLTVVAALALFAAVSGWMVQRHIEAQRVQAEAALQERLGAWVDLLKGTLPPAWAPATEQAAALQDWSRRLRVPMALDDAQGRRLAVSESFLRRQLDRPEAAGRLLVVRLDDGRTLRVPRPGPRSVARLGPPGDDGDGGLHPRAAAPHGPWSGPWSDPGSDAGPPPHARWREGATWPAYPRPPGSPGPDREALTTADAPRLLAPWALVGPGGRVLPESVGLAALLLLLLLAVAAGAWPVVRRLTRRLEALKQGVEAFGAGELRRRVAEDGRDEVAALGASFNRAATRIEALLRSHQSLLANASHELRSPLARLKMAVQLLDDAAPAQRPALQREIAANIGELDALVEEVLLASRLDAASALDRREPVALLPLAAEEAARHGVAVEGEDLTVPGDERLLRRALRNLVENARRYGGPPEGITVQVRRAADGSAEVQVCDRGPGVPEAWRERIFEPFFRLPGHAEREGGVGLGLSLVRQIAERHGGRVRCEARAGGGSCFVLGLPQRLSD
jgi:signal transduction histidine kinase